MTDPFETARNASAGMPGHSMSADVGVREALLPCCKCGGDAQMRGSRDGDVDWYQCRKCGYESPCKYSRIEAIDAWNTRALNAPTESVKAPEGWVLVPREPTEEMIGAASGVDIEVFPTNLAAMVTGTSSKEAWAVWSAMLAASPTPITADDAVAKERVKAAIGNWMRVSGKDHPWIMPHERDSLACAVITAIRSLSPDTEGEGM